MARSARRWWATGLDFQITVNFFLYNILNCLFTTKGFLSLTLQQETEIFWGLDSGSPKKKKKNWEKEEIPELYQSLDPLRGILFGPLEDLFSFEWWMDTFVTLVWKELFSRRERGVVSSMDVRPVQSHRAWHLLSCYVAAVLNFLIVFEHKVPSFNFSRGPANCVVRPAEHSLTEQNVV